jgi:hypothetical protein
MCCKVTIGYKPNPPPTTHYHVAARSLQPRARAPDWHLLQRLAEVGRQPSDQPGDVDHEVGLAWGSHRGTRRVE